MLNVDCCFKTGQRSARVLGPFPPAVHRPQTEFLTRVMEKTAFEQIIC